MIIDLIVFYFNYRIIPRGSFPQNFVKIRLDLADILRISKFDWRDGGGEGEKGTRGGILLCNGLMSLCLFVCLSVCLFVCNQNPDFPELVFGRSDKPCKRSEHAPRRG